MARKNKTIRLKSSLKAGYFLLKKIIIPRLITQSIVENSNDTTQLKNASKGEITTVELLKRYTVTMLKIKIPITENQKSSNPRYFIRLSLLSITINSLRCYKRHTLFGLIENVPDQHGKYQCKQGYDHQLFSMRMFPFFANPHGE